VPGININPLGRSRVQTDAIVQRSTYRARRVRATYKTEPTRASPQEARVPHRSASPTLLSPLSLGGGSTGGGGGGSSRSGGGAAQGFGNLAASGLQNIGISSSGALIDFATGDLVNDQRTLPDVVNITVNTVSADANLPTLIVDALQQYNLYNGPLDVQIAV
jgi:hypothetical protein